MLDVEPHNLVIIRQILQKFVPDFEIRAFGSRVNGTVKPYSDLDLVIVGKEKIKRRTRALLREEFAESNLPFRVDVLDYNAISKEFQAVVDKKYEVIQQKPGQKDTTNEG
ncbi:MAG: nucleotidyltransferase domain-containing protein [Planctomycetota bacterium]